MKNRTILALLILLPASVLAITQARSDEKTGDSPQLANTMPSPEEMAEMMKQCQLLGQPGDGHKRLDAFVGDWNLTTKMFMMPGQPPMITKGFATSKKIMDGRYILEEVSSEYSMPDPATGKMQKTPFKGMSITGYDNFRNIYTSTWIDTMSTAHLTMKGGCDPQGKVFTYYGEMDEPSMKIIGRFVKYKTTLISNDEHLFEIYDLHAGENYKVMEITYTRK